MEWYWYSLIASVVSTVYFSLMKQVLFEGVNKIVLLTCISAIDSVLLYFYARVNGISFVVESTTHLKIIALMSILATTQLVSVAEGIKKAPNPGCSQAIVVTYIVGMTIFSYFAFDCKLTAKQIIGIACVVIGCMLIVTK
jgi:drug/metabolite transporter (DMT)-like permease